MDGGGLINAFKAVGKTRADRAAFLARQPVKENALALYRENVRDSPFADPFTEVWSRAKARAEGGESIEFAAQDEVAQAIGDCRARIDARQKAAADKFGDDFLQEQENSTAIPAGQYFGPASDGIEGEGIDYVDAEDPGWLRTSKMPESDSHNTRTNALFEDEEDDDFLPGIAAAARGGAAKNVATSFVLGGVVLLMSVLGSMAR